MSTTTFAPAMARRIELWPIDRLVPYARNARTHSDEQVAQIAASIIEFGFNAPILVASDAGIVAGHGRLLAARKLGLGEVPVVVLDHLSDTQRRAYVIADNKLTLNAGWDEKMLAQELRDLECGGVDLGVVGFSDEELDDLFLDDEPQATSDAEEVVPEAPANPVTRPGDVWAIGNHRLICADCRDQNIIRELFGAARANVVITSPPYATQREYDSSSGFTPIPPDQYVAWYKDAAARVAEVLADDGSSPAYCDVIVRRMMNLTGENAVLMQAEGIMWACSVGKTFEDVAVARGVPIDQATNPKASDSRAIKHHGPNPFYGRKRKAPQPSTH